MGLLVAPVAPLVLWVPEGPAVRAGLLCVPVAPLVLWVPEGPAVRAGLLCVPVGGGPPASRPRREPLARRVGSKPGQAPPPPTGTAAGPLLPPHR